MHKKIITAVFILVLTGAAYIHISEARSGCCSHHGGVCGCGCCDGTSLSPTCAPYYPQCNGKPAAPVKKSTSVQKKVDECSVGGLLNVYKKHKASGENMKNLSVKSWWKKCPLSVRKAVLKKI